MAFREVEFNPSGCESEKETSCALPKIVLVGNPNVGKSLMFTRLTGAYANVSNYPGTTVEVFRGKMCLEGKEFEVIDTPGMYSLLPMSEEESVARRILFYERPQTVIHVADAKNLERMLCLTLQLLDSGLPLILALNIIDEAEALGLQFDLLRLQHELQIPVIATDSSSGRGIERLKRSILSYA